MADGVTYKSRLLYRLERFGEQLKPVEQVVGQMNPKERRIIVVAILILVVGLVTFWWQAHANSQSSFVTAAIKRGSVTSTIAAAGTIEPVEVVDVGAQVAGQINAFGTDKSGKPIDYRSVVAAGDVLAKIDDSLYGADLAVAKAQLERDKAGELSAQANFYQATSKLALADAEWKRMQTLRATKVASSSDYDTAESHYNVAKANISVAEAAVAQAKANTLQSQAAINKAQRNLDFCTIRSPVSGIIIDRRVNIGQTVVASLNAPSLFLIAKDLRKLQLWVAVNEAEVGRIKPGMPARFTCDAFPGREFRGAVGKVRLNAAMTENVVTYTVEVDTENPDQILLPYLTANVRFILANESNALLVPNAALRWMPSSLANVAPWYRANASVDDPPSDSAEKKGDSAEGTVWLKTGRSVRAIRVKIGPSDGANTVVSAADLREGQLVVTGETAAAAQTEAKNPFLANPLEKQ
jgi:HlyD family secretion protein